MPFQPLASLRFAVIVGAALIALSFSPAARAGGLMFTARDAGRQAAFLREMYLADSAARRGDWTGAQTALRSALLMGGYNIVAFTPGAGVACGRPAFDIPTWALTAEAAIGDSDGANYAARNLPSAMNTVDALIVIAQAQAGLDSERKSAYIFQEAVPKPGSGSIATDCDFRPHDFSALKRLHIAAKPRKAWETLRGAVVYAAAYGPAENARRAREGSSDSFGLGYTLGNIARAQERIGDTAGREQTLAKIPSAEGRAFVLTDIAEDKRESDPRAAERLQQRASRLLRGVADPKREAELYLHITQLRLGRRNFKASGQALLRSAELAGRLTDPRARDTMTSQIMFLFQDWNGGAVYGSSPLTNYAPPESRRARAQVLTALKGLANSLPDERMKRNRLLEIEEYKKSLVWRRA